MSNVFDYDETTIEITDYTDLDDSVKTIIVTAVTETLFFELSGGATGQVLSKESDNDEEFIWADNINSITQKIVIQNDVPYIGARIGDAYLEITKNINTIEYIPLIYLRVDDTLSNTSENPVQNKVIYAALLEKQDKLTIAQLAAVNSGITSAKVAQIDENTQEIDNLKNSPDVVDIVASYAALLQKYPENTSTTLGNQDIVRVLTDETHDNKSSYYQWNKPTHTWSYIGSIDNYVPTTRTIAGIDLQDNITKNELADALGISPDLNIKNGIGQFSLQQKISEDNIKNPRATGLGAIAFGGFRGDKPNGIPDEEDRSTVAEGIQSFAFGAGTYAHGNWSVAGGKDSDAYQQGSVVIGGACQAGMTEEEFDNYYGRVVQIGFIDRPEIYGEVLVPLYQNFYNVPIKLYRIDNYTGDAGQNSAELRYTDGRDIYIYYKVQWDEITSSIKGYSYAGTTPSRELSLTFIDDVLRPYASSYSQTFAVNSENKALGKYSSAFGSNTIAKHKAQLVGGMNNDNKEDTLLEIGNGTDKNNRSNAFEVTKDGVARAYGTPVGDYDLTPKSYVDAADMLKVDKTITIAGIDLQDNITKSELLSALNVADGAQVNVLDGVKDSNGNDLTITNKKVQLSKSAVGLSNVVNTGDSDTPISGGTTKFTTGGAFTEFAKKVDKTTTIAGIALSGNISAQSLTDALIYMNTTTDLDYVMGE